MLIKNGLLDGGSLVHGPEDEELDDFLDEVEVEKILGVNKPEKEELANLKPPTEK
jgi:hypothetical protein